MTNAPGDPSFSAPAQPGGIFSRILPWLVSCLILAGTVLVVGYSRNLTEARAHERFLYRAEQERAKILFRMEAHAQVLRGAAALFHSSQTVDRDEWRRYVDNLQLDKSLPGIQGTGFALMIPAAEKAAHERSMRRQGFADYAIHPSGERALYSSIVYLEPFTGRNLRAFGYDMFSEATRRSAMERARDSGKPALSGMVQLLQETDREIQPGFLIYVPVYRSAMPTATTAQRQSALLGFAYSPFRAHDLMRAVIGLENKDLELELFDGSPSPESLLFDSLNAADPAGSGHHRAILPIEFGGHVWTARFTSRQEFDANAHSTLPASIALGGLLAALLTLFWMLGNQRHQRGLAAYAERLKQSEQRLRTLIDTLPDPICLKDGAGRWTEANVQARKLFGLEAIDFRGKTGPELANNAPGKIADLLRGLEAPDEAIWANGPSLHDEWHVPQAKGGELIFDVARVPVHTLHGHRVALLTVCRDITERVTAEAALRSAERKFRGLVEQSLAGVFIIQDGRFRYVNPWFAHIFGYDTPAEIIDQRPLNDLVSPPDQTAVEEHIRRRIEGELDAIRFDFVGVRKDGGPVDVELFGTPVEYEGQAALIGVAIDVTERNLADAELNRYRQHLEEEVERRTADLQVAKEAAESANRVKTTFLANISHELRTPLNAVIGMTHLLTNQIQDPRQLDKLGKINNAGNRLLTLLNRIIETSRIDAEKLTLDAVPLNLGSVLAEVDSLIGARLAAKGLDWQLDLPDALAQVELIGDPLRLQQILLALLDNAIEFTEAGHVALRASAQREDASTLRIRFVVEDTGIGIPQEAQARIFNAFEQADGSSTRRHGGTGLGLRIVRQLIRLMLGEITVNSTPGAGSQFVFTIQMDKACPNASPPASA